MQIIPTAAIPAQRFTIVLDNQECTFVVRQKNRYLFLDLWVGDEAVCTGAICQHGANIIRDARGIFRGSVHFYDALQASARPEFTRLGARYHLLYVGDDEEVPLTLLH